MAYVTIAEPSLLAPLVTRMLVQARACWIPVKIIMTAIMIMAQLLRFISFHPFAGISFSGFRSRKSVTLIAFPGKEMNSGCRRTSRFSKSRQCDILSQNYFCILQE
jgi:hypothetical protein